MAWNVDWYTTRYVHMTSRYLKSSSVSYGYYFIIPFSDITFPGVIIDSYFWFIWSNWVHLTPLDPLPTGGWKRSTLGRRRKSKENQLIWSGVSWFSLADSLGRINDQSKEKFHSPPNSVDTFSMRPIYTPSLVEFCLNINLCNVGCIGGKLSQGGKKKTRLEIPFQAACRQWVA